MGFGSFYWRGATSATLLAALLLSTPVCAGAEVVKSDNDQREYQSFLLPNQLKVLIISDPGADKAAAALDVFVGSSSDPENRQGLAHFLEHMLFLGTEKFPQPGEYQDFISTHAGNHNAYTAFEHTNYYFDIDKAYLEPALDRFAQFFIKPLFTPEYVDREKNAVHSEYQSRKKDDNLRLHHVWKQVANPQHPFANFTVGSLDTLADRDDEKIRDELIDFHARHYSANIMALTVLGQEPLPVLKQWVVEHFSPIKNVKTRLVDVSEPLFDEERLPARVDVVPLKDRRIMRLTFPTPALSQYYRAKPVEHIANLLGHEGKGSLFSLLKKKGWIDSLSAGPRLNHRDRAVFNMSMQLTEEGLQNVDEIGAYVFQYIRLIEEHGITRRLFDEQQQINQIAFRFQETPEPIEYVRWLANNLQVYPAADVLRGPYMMPQYDPSLIRMFLAHLTPENVLVTVSAKNLHTDSNDPWFETDYSFRPLDSDTIASWRSGAIDPYLAMPERNELLPEDLAVKSPRQASDQPLLVKQVPGLDVWFQQDTDFRVPRADFYFSVRSANSNDTPEHAVLTQLYVKLVNDQLNEFYYPAYLAGLKYNLYKHSRGFSVRVSGYNDKQEILINRIVEALREPVITPANFALAQEELTRALKNARREPPHRQTLSEVPKLLLQPHWTEAQRLTIVQRLTVNDLRRFVPQLLGQINVVALAHGNLYRDEALAFAQVLEERLLVAATPARAPRNQVVKLPDTEQYVRQLEIDHPDSAIAVYAQGNDKRYETRVMISLTAHILSSPFYNDLRTDKQLGYVVYTTAMPLLEAPGIAFVVESPTTDPNALEEHVQRFLSDYSSSIDRMSDNDFERHKNGLLTLILEEENQLRMRSDRYWREIDRKNYEFDSRKQLADALRRITREQFVAFYQQFLLGENGKRLVVRSIGSEHQAAFAKHKPARDYIVISDPAAFKQNKEYFPRISDSL